MGRFEYDSYGDVEDVLNMGRQEGNLRRHLNGKKGQALLKELEQILLNLPEKRLIKGELANVRLDGDWLEEKTEFCTIGALAAARGIPLYKLTKTPEETLRYDRYEQEERTQSVGQQLGLVQCLIWELAYQNDSDEFGTHILQGKWSFVEETPEQRSARILKWVQGKIIESTRTAEPQES